MTRVLVVSKSELYFRILEPNFRAKGIEICGILKVPVNIPATYASSLADVIILDANWYKLPVTGAEILRSLLSVDSTLKIITVTNSPEIESLEWAKRLGAKGYFYRTANDISGIARCINRVAAGDLYFMHPVPGNNGTTTDQHVA